MRYDHIEMVKGDSAEFEMSVIDPRTLEPVDLSGATARFMVKENYADDDGDAIISVDTSTGITIAIDIIHVSVPADATENLDNEISNMFWDLQVESGSKRWTVGRGTIGIYPEVVQV